MFIFSQISDWKDDKNIKQVLCFPDESAAKRFEISYSAPNRSRKWEQFPDENGIGAIYKLRAVKNNKGGWDSVIRSGYNGHTLFEQDNKGDITDYKDALRICFLHLTTMVNDSIVEASLRLL